MAEPQRDSVPIRTFGVQDTPAEEQEGIQQTPASAVRRVLSRLSFGASSKRRPSLFSTADGGDDDQPPIPTMGSGETDATPLPKLSMIVLSIATVAEKHGRRAVLVVSLLGTALTCLMFGTATSLKQAICIRLLQGVFAGNVGVARGSVAFITDPSNEGRAYAILGFCWGFGGVAGAIVGGSFERPADKWPEVFRDIPLFNTYPYILPCAIASGIMLSGSILACFLGPDGGPREGAIQLPLEKDNNHPTIPEEDSVALDSPFEEEESTGLMDLKKKISRRFSNIFAKRVPDINPNDNPSSSTTLPLNIPPGTSLERTRTFSRTSRANGSAYGYSGAYRNRLASNATLGGGVRRGSLASTLRQRRGSNYDGVRDSTDTSDLNFAQRLLMANENAVTNIADLWVASAMNVDNENPFESDEELEEEDEFDFGTTAIEGQDGGPSSQLSRPSRHRPSSGSLLPPNLRRPSSARRSSFRRPSVSFSPTVHAPRRPSIVPSIFSHSGVRTPPGILEAQKLLSGEGDDHLDTIAESRQASQSASQADAESLQEPPPSLASQLPVLIIVQYGVMALHTTTHDQIFMSYLVSPPRGRFSHLAMFRIGTVLFIPSYLTVTLYRPLASAEDGGNLLLMIALVISTAIRYAGTVFGYTAISILLNYMSPPAAVGYANGIAQSIVSLARCVGPVIGGWLWSASVQDHPSGYYLGFVICAAVCALTVAQSFLIR
ncbi:hypothetical protein D9611_007169 [Ephemerocybe angulata]|uniref:Major facilitator superfamily MFS-1 n=1 Tax=Ephemerocybe angulata TaxID=980116 RepID=A0A8H5B0Q8_9AGAR|nr:hypothetical protein D9611_007169 [Tulosesus angulatus]